MGSAQTALPSDRCDSDTLAPGLFRRYITLLPLPLALVPFAGQRYMPADSQSAAQSEPLPIASRHRIQQKQHRWSPPLVRTSCTVGLPATVRTAPEQLLHSAP